jgi:hypothetical protein
MPVDLGDSGEDGERERSPRLARYISTLGNQEFILQQAFSGDTRRLALVAVALRLPVGLITNNWKPLAMLLGLVMPIMWLVSGLLTYLILGVPLLVAILLLLLQGSQVAGQDP